MENSEAGCAEICFGVVLHRNALFCYIINVFENLAHWELPRFWTRIFQFTRENADG